MLKTMVKFALGAAAIGLLVAHRKSIMALVKGEPMPEAPDWHKRCGIHKNREGA